MRFDEIFVALALGLALRELVVTLTDYRRWRIVPDARLDDAPGFRFSVAAPVEVIAYELPKARIIRGGR